MNLRGPLARALRSGLPGASVIGHPSAIGRPAKPTACVWASTVTPLNGAQYEVEITVQLFVPEQTTRGPGADNRLDDFLGDVLAVIWASPELVIFDRAERTTNEDRTLNSWTVTVRGAITTTEEPAS